MIRSSVGQLNADAAKFLYKAVGRHADTLVTIGKVAAADRGLAFDKLAASALAKHGITPSKQMLAAASKELPFVDALVARSAEKATKLATTAVSSTGTVAKTAATSAGAAVARQSAIEAAKSTTRGAAPIAAAIFAIEGVYNLARFANGDISRAEVVRRTGRSAASNGGGVAGAAAGAAVGSVVPIVGTAIGAVVGGIAGGVLSGWLAGKAMS